MSTDYDECDRLYFEELSLERVLDIYQQEVRPDLVARMSFLFVKYKFQLNLDYIDTLRVTSQTSYSPARVHALFVRNVMLALFDA